MHRYTRRNLKNNNEVFKNLKYCIIEKSRRNAAHKQKKLTIHGLIEKICLA